MTAAPDGATLRTACETLAERDPALARAYEALGVPVWRSGTGDYEALARMIAHQQISTRAAGAIWQRTAALLGEVSAERLLQHTEDDLRGCGLSRPKVAHLRAIADAVTAGHLCFERLRTAELDDARAELLAVKGIGPWTADLFLLYSGVVDAFPVGDVALVEAHRQLSGAETRMTAKAFTAHAESWQPYRGVAAHLLWGWINAQRESADRL